MGKNKELLQAAKLQVLYWLTEMVRLRLSDGEETINSKNYVKKATYLTDFLIGQERVENESYVTGQGERTRKQIIDFFARRWEFLPIF